MSHAHAFTTSIGSVFREPRGRGLGSLGPERFICDCGIFEPPELVAQRRERLRAQMFADGMSDLLDSRGWPSSFELRVAGTDWRGDENRHRSPGQRAKIGARN